MHIHSLAKAAWAVLACGGVALAVGAAIFAFGSPYRDLLIVAGIDAFTIGLTGFIVTRIFSSRQPTRLVDPDPLMRSLDNSEGQELKRMLVGHLSRAKPISISFPADDAEARRFAGQIARFLHKHRFDVTSFDAEAPTLRLDPGIGINGSNHILVGPIRASAPSPIPIESQLPVTHPLASNDAFRADLRAYSEPLGAELGG
jgi:hypothetical protein